MALAAAAFGATIPGFLKINFPLWGKGALAAGGALALFVIVYRINPPALGEDAWVNPNPERHLAVEVDNHIGTDLPDCNATNSAFESMLFDNAMLADCDFTDSVVSKARFKDANASNVDFTNREAYGVSFRNAAVVGSDFTESILTGANFQGADVISTQFWGARLFNADFREADVRGAKFAGSDISGADFRGVLNLTQEQINTAFYDPNFNKPLRLPDGFSPSPTTMQRA